MPALLLRPTVILSVLLLLSIFASTMLYKLHSHDLKKIAALEANAEQFKAQVREQNKAVDALRKAADDKAAASKRALAKAEAERILAERKATEVLMLKPTHPEDPCASAMDLNKQMLLERRAR